MFSFFRGENKKVSIVVIVYNRVSYIKACLDSILSQSIVKEIICIDDFSTDGTYEILEEYALKYSEIKLYRNSENKGTVISRYRGLSHCTGEYMLFVDSDDILLPDTLDKIYDEAVFSKADILEFSAETDGKDSFKKLLDRPNSKITSNILEAYMKNKITNQIWNKLISKKVYKKTLKKLNSDLKQANYADVVYFLYNFFSNAENVVTTKSKGYFYYDNTGMTATMSWLEKYKEYCSFAPTYRELLEVYGHSVNIKNIWNGLCNQAIWAYLHLTPDEQKQYKSMLYEIMSEEGAELLIAGHIAQQEAEKSDDNS